MSTGIGANYGSFPAAAGNAAAPAAAGGKAAGKGLGWLAAVPILGSLLENIGSGKRERQARAHNKKMWDLQNAYNHPTQQMARLQEAGLNPRLIYGSSPGSATGNAGAIAPGKAPEYKMNAVGAVTAYNNTRAITAQTQNLNAMSRLSDAKTLREIYGGRKDKVMTEAVEKAKTAIAEGIFAENQTKSLKYAQELVNTNVMTQTEAARVERYLEENKKLKADRRLTSEKLLFQKFVSKLAKDGFTVNDPKYLRLLVTRLEESGSLDHINNEVSKFLRSPVQYFKQYLADLFIQPFTKQTYFD